MVKLSAARRSEDSQQGLMRNSKKLLVIVLLPLLVSILVIPLLGGRSSASEVGESHEAVDAQSEHANAEGHDNLEAAHNGEHQAEHQIEPWWKFTGWEAIFAILSSTLFLLLLRWLPLLLEDKTGEEIK